MQTALFFLIFAILALASVLVILVLKKKPERIYKPKGQFLLSPGEKRFFDALVQSIPPSIYICPKVRIADLIETKRERSDPLFWQEQSKINQKHIDFVLCNRSDFAPQVAVELDGGSHKDAQRLKRDSFINSVFDNTGIPLVHIPVSSFYHYANLRRLIDTAIRSNQKSQEPQQIH